MEFPNNYTMPTHITSASKYANTQVRCLGDTANTWVSAAGTGSVQWLVPLSLPVPYLIASFFVCFGTSPGTGVFECGIFSAPSTNTTALKKIMGTASTACVNTSNNVQIVAPSGGSKLLSAGNYYMAYVSTGTNAIISRAASTPALVQTLKGSGVLFGPTATSLSSGNAQQLTNSVGTYRLPLFGVSRLASGY